MDMEEIFQELIVSVGISVAVCYMVMKLRSHVDEESVETCMKSVDGIDKEVLHDQKRVTEAPPLYDFGETARAWSCLGELFGNLSVENIYGNNVRCSSEITSEAVEDAEFLQVPNKDKKSSVDDEVNFRTVEDIVISDELKGEEKIVGGKDGVEEEILVDENFKRLDLCEIEAESAEPVEERLERSDFRKIVCRLSEEKDVVKEDDHGGEKEEGLFDDWEGVERTELEKLFGAAVAFVGSKSNGDLIDRDLKIQLYGLHKIAIEGPCQGPQPLAFKVSARAKWNSWRILGNMNRELAMEQYLTLLSKSIPGWKICDTSVLRFGLVAFIMHFQCGLEFLPTKGDFLSVSYRHKTNLLPLKNCQKSDFVHNTSSISSSLHLNDGSKVIYDTMFLTRLGSAKHRPADWFYD